MYAHVQSHKTVQYLQQLAAAAPQWNMSSSGEAAHAFTENTASEHRLIMLQKQVAAKARQHVVCLLLTQCTVDGVKKTTVLVRGFKGLFCSESAIWIQLIWFITGLLYVLLYSSIIIVRHQFSEVRSVAFYSAWCTHKVSSFEDSAYSLKGLFTTEYREIERNNEIITKPQCSWFDCSWGSLLHAIPYFSSHFLLVSLLWNIN